MKHSLYLDAETWIHRLDARTKFAGLLTTFAMAVLFSDPRYLSVLVVGLLAGTTLAHAMVNVRRLWVLLVLLFVYSAVLWPIFIEGQRPIVKIGTYVVTMEGIIHGVGMGLRLNAMVMSGILFLSTTTIEDFTYALSRLGVPQSVGFALSLAFRWVPTLITGIAGILQAQRSRGLDMAAGSMVQKIRRYSLLVVPLIGHTLRRTNLLAMALESKGIGPGRRRRVIEPSTLTRVDVLALGVCAGVLLGCVWLRVHGYGTIETMMARR
ncbi:MAG: energy-coupling factor transporter transmembrane protein EcfT [Nitrospirae bacterium]|nr:MAG: energy-coupling factor transporter transmembrane protein EcfT [Nitrospirota bacterium]